MKEAFADKVIALCGRNGKRMEPGFANPNDRNRISGWVRDQVTTARRYYLDDDVTRAAVTLGVQHPEILLQMLRRARTPFRKVWIEWNIAPQLEAAGVERLEDAAESVGVLIEALDDEKPVYRLTEIGITTDGSNHVCPYPFSAVYNLEDPNFLPARRSDYDLIQEATGANPVLMRNIFVGSAYVGKTDERYAPMDPEEAEFRKRQCDALTSHVTYGFTPHVGDVYRDILTGRYRFEGAKDQMPVYDLYQPIVRNLLHHNLLEFSGTWRIAIAMLALLNARDFVASDEPWKAGKSRIVGGKIMPYLSHHIVKLKLPRRVVEQRMVRQLGESIPRRRHEVGGYWAESRKKGDPNCEHVFVQETPTREACVCCEKKRWWVRDHERGTAELGYVTKDRLVTAA